MAPRKERDPVSTIVNNASLSGFSHDTDSSKLIVSHSSTDQETTFVFTNLPEYLHYAQANLPRLCELLQQCKTTYIDWKYHVVIPRTKLKEIAELVVRENKRRGDRRQGIEE